MQGDFPVIGRYCLAKNVRSEAPGSFEIITRASIY